MKITSILSFVGVFASIKAIPTIQFETGAEVASGDFAGDFHILEQVHHLSSKNIVFDLSTGIVTEFATGFQTEPEQLNKRRLAGVSSIKLGNGIVQTRIVDKKFAWTRFQPVTSCFRSGDSETTQDTPYTINYSYNASNGVSYASIRTILAPPKGYKLVQNDLQKNTSLLQVPAHSVGQTWASRAVINYLAQQRDCDRRGLSCSSWSSNIPGHVAVTGKKKSLTQSESKIGDDNVQC